MTSMPSYRAPALEKGLDILEALAREEEALPLTALSERLGRSKSEIFRMVQVLETRGYLSRRAGKEGYVLTNKLFRLSLSRPVIRGLVEVALPEMRSLSERSEQSCHLVVSLGTEIVIIARMEAPSPIGLAVRVGMHLPIATTPSGRVLFAFQSEATQAEWLTRMRAAGFENEKDFLARTREIRTHGYEMSESPFIGGVTDLSSPILGPEGTAVATLTMPHIAKKPVRLRMRAALDYVRTAAGNISASLHDEAEKFILA